jgi:hypothetical protein
VELGEVMGKAMEGEDKAEQKGETAQPGLGTTASSCATSGSLSRLASSVPSDDDSSHRINSSTMDR